MNFVRRIPSSWKYRDGQTKYILKKALEPLLPASNMLYRKKQGFGVPIGAWFKDGQLGLDEATVPQVDGKGFVRRCWPNTVPVAPINALFFGMPGCWANGRAS